MTKPTTTPLTTTLFAGAAFYRALRTVVAPHLRTWPYVNVWLVGPLTGGSADLSADRGSSLGTDAYSIAIALREEGLRGRVRVHATDVDDAAIRRAREGAYSAAALPVAHKAYVDGGGRASLTDYVEERGETIVVRDDVRTDVVFAVHSPQTDASFAEQQLIVCRGSLAAYSPAVRARAWRVLHESLCRFGVLAVRAEDGIAEHPCAGRYEPIDAKLGLYRRGDA